MSATNSPCTVRQLSLMSSLPQIRFGVRAMTSTPPSPLDSPMVVPPDATLQSPFDAVDTHCTVDADCDVVTIEVTGVHACCSSCATTAGNKGWAERLRTACAARPPGICFPLGCPMGPTHTRCDAGRCVLEAGP